MKKKTLMTYNVFKKHYRVTEGRNILHTIKIKKANWIGRMMGRNCLTNHVTEAPIEGRTEVMGSRG
jgi:hypothetical protein